MIFEPTCFRPLLQVRMLFAPSNGSFSDDINSIGVDSALQLALMWSMASGECTPAPAAPNVMTARKASLSRGAASSTPVPPTLAPTSMSRVGSM
jgi:hypothetical protein